MCEIEFLRAELTRGDIPEPYPASRHIPDWFKNMQADTAGGQGTLKRCSPFLEAMTAGYIIPAPADLQLTLDYVGINAFGTYEFLARHDSSQYEGAPFETRKVLKFYNPWIIVTPPEYVCLITAPINRYEMPFAALTGIVETGQHYAEVHLPVICLMNPGDSYQLRAGTPMIQVIPFRRDEWTSRTGPCDITRREEEIATIRAHTHHYKDQIWKKLRFACA